MTLSTTTLFAAALLCGLTAGFLFCFAVVVMPGIRRLPDRDFLRAFRFIDRVIQENSPLFVLMWVGSVLALLGAAATGLGPLSGIDRWLLVGATLAYIFGVQAPTLAINVPLNNRLQALDLDRLDAEALQTARRAFEGRWNRWNVLRTACACLTTIALLAVLMRL